MSSANFGRVPDLCVWILIFVILRNVGAYSQSELLTSLKQYEVVVPSRVTRDGNHVTYDIHPGHSLRRRSVDINRKHSSDDTLHYQVQIENKNYVLQLTPNNKLTSPGFVVERMKHRFRNVTDSKFTKLAPEHRNCHYHGNVVNGTRSRVAVGVCKGLHGFIHTDDDQYFIEPLHDEVLGTNGQHKHVLYKRSAVSQDMDPLGSMHVHKRSTEDDSCGVKEFTKQEKRRERWEQHQRHKRKSSDHHRQKRSFSTERYAETLVVVDPSMVKYYKNEHLETYVLTIMNMVATMFHDASIGNSINIILVRILVIEEDHDDLTITHHADRTLTSFCNFQKKINFKDDDHPNHHDVAVLFTRKNICSRLDEPCSTLGLAQVSGMCQPHWSCNINEDTGLALAFTVTHELGHNFGMHHDGHRNGCADPPGKQLFLMSPSLVADSLTKTWSNCSRDAITQFIDRDWGYCLNDEPGDHEYNFPVLPAGTMYDANHQCRLQYGSDDSTICTDEQDVCANLWCRTENRCSTHLEAAAEGTICGANKWCYQGKCVKIADRPESINGEWGEWTSWSDCTRSCDGGVSHSQRHCDNPQPSHGGKYCLGERKRYRICNTEECADSEKSFNQVQCEEFNYIPYKGHYYEWEHVLAVESPCQLHCKPKNRFFSTLMKDIVTDGTPCTPGTPNMCISGRCRHIGCDYMIDSKAKEDRCGVCHGDGSTCTTIKAQFNESKGLGYVEATVIPRGARNIRVEELAEANNFLALQNDKGEYYLNGHWFIQWSGEYDIAGTVVQYTRIGNKESFQAPGPLKEPLHIMLLLQSANPGVSFEYTVPKDNITETRTPEFHWLYLHWTHCTASCGGGTQRSEVVCSEIEAGVVDDKYCGADKPDDKQKFCNDHLCPARWWVGPWQHCSVTCGKDGTHQRTVICIRSMGLDEQIALDDEACNTEIKPPEVEPCHKKEPCPGNSSWIVGEWSKCDDNMCGMKYRNVRCRNPAIGCEANAIPPSEMACSNVSCGQWIAGEWSQCPVTCGIDQQTRAVKCEEGKQCNRNEKPPETKMCILKPCPVVTLPVSSTSATSPVLSKSSVTTTADGKSHADKLTENLPTESNIDYSSKSTKFSSTVVSRTDSPMNNPDKTKDISKVSVDQKDDSIEIESFDNPEEIAGWDHSVSQTTPNEKIGIDHVIEESGVMKGDLESESYEPDQEKLFDIEPENIVDETNVATTASVRDGVAESSITSSDTIGNTTMKQRTDASNDEFITSDKNSKESYRLHSEIKTVHKHRHHHGDKSRHDVKPTVFSVDSHTDSDVANLNTDSDTTELTESINEKENDIELEESNYQIVEEDYDVIKGSSQSELEIVDIKSEGNSNQTIEINTKQNAEGENHVLTDKTHDVFSNMDEMPGLPEGDPEAHVVPALSQLPPIDKQGHLKPNNVKTEHDLGELPELDSVDKLPHLSDLKDFPRLPKDQLKPLPDLKDLPPIPDLKDLPPNKDIPNLNTLPTLPDKQKLAPLPDLKDLSNKNLEGLPNLNDLPKLPNKENLAQLPNIGDLPPMPDLKDLQSKKMEEFPNLDYLPKLPNKEELAPLPDLENLPPIPDLKDLPNKKLPNLNGLPKLPNKENLVPLPDMKDLPPIPDLNFLPGKTLPEIANSPSLQDKEDLASIPEDTQANQKLEDLPNKDLVPLEENKQSENVDAAENDKSQFNEKDMDAIPLSNQPIEIKQFDIKNTKDLLPHHSDKTHPANVVIKPLSQTNSEITDSASEDSLTITSDLLDKPDINVNNPDKENDKVIDTVLQLPDTMKSIDETNPNKQQVRWKPSKWTECSRPCGDGVRTRTVSCVNEREEEVEKVFCDINTKPTAIEDCFLQDCAEWRVSQWSECSATCGHSVRYRNVACPDKGVCDQRIRPADQELCSQPDCVKWMSGQWSKCSKKCEGGEQVRLVQCVNLTSQLSSRGCGLSDKPSERQRCNEQPCKNHNAALTITCQHNEMSSVVCHALRRMGQCHRRFVSLKCCQTCKTANNKQLNKHRPRSRALR